MPVPDAGDDVVVPDDEPPADEVVPAPDAAAPPDEPEPAADPGASAPPAADALPAPDPGTPAPVPAPVPDGAASPVAPESAPASDSPIGKASSGQSLRSFVETPAREQRARTPATVSLAPAQPTAPVAQSSAPAGTVLVTTVSSSRGATSRSRPARRGDRTHVVAPGESLWSIADDLLGEDASVARVAREVNRLWELNSRRIGTGDPSLVHVATTLLL
jgi:hypothetical protein